MAALKLVPAANCVNGASYFKRDIVLHQMDLNEEGTLMLSTYCADSLDTLIRFDVPLALWDTNSVLGDKFRFVISTELFWDPKVLYDLAEFNMNRVYVPFEKAKKAQIRIENKNVIVLQYCGIGTRIACAGDQLCGFRQGADIGIVWQKIPSTYKKPLKNFLHGPIEKLPNVTKTENNS